VNDSGFITVEAIPSDISSFNNDVGYITASALPTKVSELENDSGFITLAQVPTPSYIEDATGNRINANLSCTYIDNAWEVTDPSSNKYVLEYVGFIQSYHTWECVEPENIKLVLTYANEWSLKVYTWQEIGPGGDNDWVLDITGSYNGDSDITTIPYFVNATTTYNYSAQRPVTKYLTLATKDELPTKTSDLVNDSGFVTASQVPPVPSNLSEYNNDVGFITASAIPSNVGAFTNDVGYLTASDVSTSALYPSSPYSAYVQIDDYGEVNAKKLLNETGVWFVKAIIEQYTPNPVTGYWVSPPKITDNGTNILAEFWVQDKERKYEPQKITYGSSSSSAVEMLITVEYNNVVFRVQLKKSTQADIPTWIDCGRLVRDGDANTCLRISQLEDDIGLVHDISDKRDLTDISYSGKDEDAFFLGVGSFTIELPDTWTATEQKTYVLDNRQKNQNYYKLWSSSPAMFYINTLNEATFYIMDISSTEIGSFNWNQVKGGDKVAVTITYKGVEYPCHVQANWEATTLATANDVVKMSKNNTLLKGENIRINTNNQENIGVLVANQNLNGYALTQSGIAKYDSNAATKTFNFPSGDATGSTFATREWVQSQGYSSGASVDDYIPVTIHQNLESDSTNYKLRIYNSNLSAYMEY